MTPVRYSVNMKVYVTYKNRWGPGKIHQQDCRFASSHTSPMKLKEVDFKNHKPCQLCMREELIPERLLPNEKA